ncbi:signal peptidase II [bacterium]|nr:signal peptidase II [bacterium]
MRRLWSAALFVFVLDAITKAMAWDALYLTSRFTFPGAPWASLVAVRNEGLILGYLAGQPHLVVFVMAFAVLNLQAYLAEETSRRARSPLLFPAGLVLGGALGNLADRMTRGFVVDFISIGNWPVFNIADAAVVAGIMMMVGVALLRPFRPAKPKDAPPDR